MFYKETATVDGNRLSYVRCGDWSSEAILFFHGFTGSKEYFPDSEIGGKCILSFDRFGVGESSVVPYYTMESFCKAVNAVLKDHGVSKAALIGHSAGGYYAQVFAQMFPETVSSLSLISSMVPLNCPDTKSIVKGQWKSIVTLSLKFKGFSRSFFRKMAKGITTNYEKQLADNMKTLPEIEKKFMEEHPDMIKNAIMNAAANEGLGMCYDAYALCLKRDKVTVSPDIPVYVWYGSEDNELPMSFTEYFKATYPVKEVHIIDKVGHMLYLTNWDEIIGEISGSVNNG